MEKDNYGTSIIFDADVIAAAQEYKNAGAWQGLISERQDKMRAFIARLAAIYEIEAPELAFENIGIGRKGTFSGASCFMPDANKIVMRGRLSVLTLLHEFAHALGMESEPEARRWSIELFKKVFPEQFARLNNIDGMMVKNPAEIEALRASARARNSGGDAPISVADMMRAFSAYRTGGAA